MTSRVAILCRKLAGGLERSRLGSRCGMCADAAVPLRVCQHYAKDLLVGIAVDLVSFCSGLAMVNDLP